MMFTYLFIFYSLENPFPTTVVIDSSFENLPPYLQESYRKVTFCRSWFLIRQAIILFKAYWFFAKMVLTPMILAQIFVCWACYKIGKKFKISFDSRSILEVHTL